ncbi:unnamed protein product [Lactuca saligna]|uniref:DUF7950 domain-containing protein n=1 Tax=Lactuca saligna TaxID=75948 RepID=A0AA36DZ84_LACSI|nr:unnamed protein product [Lactuca saligna]
MGGGNRRGETGSAGGDPKSKMIINQIMLRYRPIAPRPVTVERSVGVFPLKEKRAKRKYVRVKKKMARECKLTVVDDGKRWRSLDETVAMLEVSNGGEFVVTDPVGKVPEFISFDVSGHNRSDNNIIGSLITPAPPSVVLHDIDLAMTVKRGAVIESWITMESVTGMCEDRRWLRCTDDEIMKDLEIDSCPSFISNTYNEVQWVNLAYRRMVASNPDGGAPPCQVLVRLCETAAVVKYWPAFSCRVRLVYKLSEKKKQMTVPCDVWKMDSGGYAWRLDVEAALSLGRLN